MKIIAFFNNKGGVGKTSLVYHLAWMFTEQGKSVFAIDLDPQANLTSMFVDEEKLEEIWPNDDNLRKTIYGAISPIMKGTGDISNPHVLPIQDNLKLIPGDLTLSRFEDKLSDAWPRCHNRDESSFRVVSAFYRVIRDAPLNNPADIALIDVGPNLGAINRAAMIAADYIIIPMSPDLYSLQGLRNLGPTLKVWRREWSEIKEKCPTQDLALPQGRMDPLGYIVMQHVERSKRPVKAYSNWIRRIPKEYRDSVIGEDFQVDFENIQDDPHCLALLKHYQSLMPMAMEARKPMFFLKPADGAIGAHSGAVTACYNDFFNLSNKILELCRLK